MATSTAGTDQAMAAVLVVSTRPNDTSASTAPRLNASFTDTAPVVTGLCAVRLTCLSKSRSATSFTQQPALRMRKVPSTNTTSRCQPGKPSAAIHSADNVGHRHTSQPAGRSQGIRSRESEKRRRGETGDDDMMGPLQEQAQQQDAAAGGGPRAHRM